MKHESQRKFLIGAITVVLVGLALFFVLRPHNSGKGYRTFTSPDGRYRIVVYAFSASLVMPGQSGDVPGVVRLYETETGKVLEEQKVEMVQLIEPPTWSPTNVDIKLFADWKLPRPLQVFVQSKRNL
ncbi:MAG: uncharacterized protein JWR19_2912 [Pedosphaera sp.]|jgi:hypothetical protein|nr:uncharacterized protein [Pedosphaera sp.]